jgi:protein-S-isoprenylcysteine O-methyltransferase Ste14
LYTRLSEWPGYDIFMRLPALVYFALVLEFQGQGVADLLLAPKAGPADAVYATALAARLAAVAVTLLFFVLTLVREKPVLRARGLAPRIVAFLGSTFLFASAFLPRAEPTMAWDIASALLSAVGGVLTATVVLGLGRSFSTMAEARKLVTTGAYFWVRHPLYLAEEMIIIGGFLQYRSWAAAAIVVTHFALQLERMRFEEAVLGAAFPEYENYRRRTARLVPGLY